MIEDESQNKNPEFLNLYLKYEHVISQCSTSTVRESYYDIRTFMRYLIITNSNNTENFTKEVFKNISISDVTLDDIQKVTSRTVMDYILFLRNELENCAKSRNRKLASIKTFFKYLYANNLINIDPTANIQFGSVEKRNVKYLTLEESKKMLSAVIKANDKNNLRNYTIICVLLNCCLRAQEIVNINISNIDFNEKTIKILGKGNKERIVYINEAVEEALKEYLKIRPELGKSNYNYDALFLSGQKKRISKRTVQYITEESFKKAFDGDGKKQLHTHSLRHTGASLMYNENDTDIFILQKILGHDNLASTQIYTHVSNEKLKNIMNNFSISNFIENKEVISNG